MICIANIVPNESYPEISLEYFNAIGCAWSVCCNIEQEMDGDEKKAAATARDALSVLIEMFDKSPGCQF